MSHRITHLLLSVGLAASIVVACTPKPWEVEPLEGSGAGDSGTAGNSTTMGADCNAPTKLEPTDLSKLPKCCTSGPAHCMPADRTPSAYRASLAACENGGSCIPDELIASGGAKPPSCKTKILGMDLDGACLSVCIPKIAAKKAFLNKGNCAGGDDIVCAPCVSPEDNKPTGACEIGQSKSSQAPPAHCTDAGAAGSRTPGSGGAAEAPTGCCGGRGKCVAPTSLEESVSANSTAQECSSDAVCVPTELASGTASFKPKSCSPTFAAGLLGADHAVCVSDCLDFGIGEIFVSHEGCGANEKCAPCSDILGPVPGCGN